MSQKQKHVLVVNAGSSSVKFAVFYGGDRAYKGQFDRVGSPECVHKVSDAAGNAVSSGTVTSDGSPASHADCFRKLVNVLSGEGVAIDAVGHRVVHGGTEFLEPVLLNEETIAKLDALKALAPLHQPHNLAGVRACQEELSGIPQVACFDTAFHRHRDPVSRHFAIPRRYADAGVKKYGFHGLSYDHIASRIPQVANKGEGSKVAVCHLGNGSSVCAIKDGKGVMSSMGFTALEGLPMGTRCGSIDPGVLLHLMETEGMGPKELTNLLYKESGLLGLSGISSDVRDLEKAYAENGNDGAELALCVFADRIAEEVALMAQAMRGLESVVFTAGIGENSALVRRLVCERLDWGRGSAQDLRLDEAANQANATRITLPSSRISVFVIPTDEEGVIARATEKLTSQALRLAA